jgi:hypothetical protein
VVAEIGDPGTYPPVRRGADEVGVGWDPDGGAFLDASFLCLVCPFSLSRFLLRLQML